MLYNVRGINSVFNMVGNEHLPVP
jgi:hypothetical protein